MNRPPSRLVALLDELKRRRVLNVAAVYLVGMWLLIQVADITFTRLGMPDWTVTFVIVLGALFFPVVVGLAWAFDLTRAGITRTPPLNPVSDVPAQPSSAAPPGSRPASAPVATGGGTQHHRRLTLVLAALMTLPLVAFGWWWTSARGVRGADLDRNVVMVTPFRLAGASADLGYLREGLMDLIAARIGGAGSDLSVVAPRSVSRRIKETLGSLDADPDRDEARGLAAGFGAGLLLEGELVGTPAGFTVTARLFDVRTGYRRDDAELRAHPDSLHQLVDRIAARLVAAESGLREDRLASLTTASMPALRAFLEGEQAFRRGDHDVSVRAYDRAVTLDSTFALAALGLLRARGWAVGLRSDNAARAEVIVRRGLDRLSEPDRLFFEAYLGDEGPEFYRDVVDRRIQAAQRMPDLAELQYLAGDGVLHYGRAVGIPDAYETARRYFERTIAMDSTYVEPLAHLHTLAYMAGDTAGVRRYGDLLMAVDSTGIMATVVRYARAQGGEGTRTAAPLVLDTLDFIHLMYAATLDWEEAPEEPLVTAVGAELNRAVTAEDRARVAEGLMHLGMRLGRPTLVEQATDASMAGGGEDEVGRVVRALYWTRDLEAARRAAPDLERAAAAARRGAPAEAPVPSAATVGECMLGHLRVAERDAAGAVALAESLERAVRPGRSPWWNAYDRVCADFLRTAAAVHRGAPDARQRMAALHETLGAGAPRPSMHYALYDLASIDLWERLGQPERALEAARRRVDLPEHATWHTQLEGEQARLAEQLGHRDEALRAWARYLSWLEGGEGVFASRADQARAALERLTGRG